MSSVVDDLRAAWGGTWDGASPEIHALIKHGGRHLKIELVHDAQWSCAVFDRGACLAMTADEDPRTAVRVALLALEQ